MPYNFEATFTQPLLAELDAGRIGNAQSWANAITRHYLNTVKLGMPQGVPLVLPAPGLNPGGPPPPFTIGTSPYTTVEARRHLMYNVIYSYFHAKELKLQRNSIEGTISAIKQVLRKIKRTTERVKALNNQIKLITEQLDQLPSLLKHIDEGIGLFVKDQVDQLNTLLDSVQDGTFGVQISPQELRTVFGEELRAIEDVKQFSLTNKEGITRLATFLERQSQTSDQLLDSNSRHQLIKLHLTRRLTRLVKEMLNFVQLPLQPNLFIDYANNLERTSTKFRNFARAIRQIAFIERFIRPKLAKLKALVNGLVSRIKNKLQLKVKALREKLATKIKLFNSNSNQGKSGGLFKKARRTIRQERQKNARLIANQTARVKAGRDLIKQCVALGVKTTALTVSLEQELISAKAELAKKRRKLLDIEDLSTDLTRARSETRIELDQLSNYLEGNGLGSFYQLSARLLSTTGSSARDLITLFEQRKTRYKLYAREIAQVGQDIRAIQDSINVLFGSGTKRSKSRFSLDVGQTPISLKSLLELIVKWLKPKLASIVSWLRKFVNSVTKFIKDSLRKAQQALAELAQNLIPGSSASRDPINKKKIRRAKARALRDKATKARTIARRLSILTRAIPAAAALAGNVTRGRFKLSENQASINKIANAIYSYKRQDQPASIQHKLVSEQQKFTSNFNSLMVAESIASILILTRKSLGAQAKREVDQTFAQLSSTAQPLDPNKAKTLQALRELVDNPPTALDKLERAGDVLGAAVVQDVSTTNRLVEMEKRILRTTRQAIQVIVDNQALKQRYQQALVSGNTSGLFFVAYQELQKISVGLSRQQSLILMCLRALYKILSKLYAWIRDQVTSFINKAIKALTERLKKLSRNSARESKHRAGKGLNLDGFLMSTAFGLATRALWTGASWVGPTGSNHTAVSIGGFRPRMRAKVEDGATGFVREMARGFQTQLELMRGIVVPPAVTGIAPQQFVGYN